jgi:hypothetical protein
MHARNYKNAMVAPRPLGLTSYSASRAVVAKTVPAIYMTPLRVDEPQLQQEQYQLTRIGRALDQNLPARSRRSEMSRLLRKNIRGFLHFRYIAIRAGILFCV